METIEDLKKTIRSTGEIGSVVRTMKALAAVNIRQYTQAVHSLARYNRAVELALKAALRNRPGLSVGARKAPREAMGAVVFGSDMGMAGQLNERVIEHAFSEMERLRPGAGDTMLVAVGHRAANRLEDAGLALEQVFPVPGGVEGITPAVQDLLDVIQQWNTRKNITAVVLFYARPRGQSSFTPTTVELLPLDRRWLDRVREEPWPTKALPMLGMDWEPLFSSLVSEYLFAGLFRAFADSAASENASRLASMQGAEKNIDQKLADLNAKYHQRRQMTITEELLDIVSGFEALKKGK
ncbi:MAG: F0F1 ATP synthase subunit gamma [Deltaproteobacteria bacterium]|nr:F0F1 ATP synthase subunit gamma [Deltaproteobacteria bacterium]